MNTLPKGVWPSDQELISLDFYGLKQLTISKTREGCSEEEIIKRLQPALKESSAKKLIQLVDKEFAKENIGRLRKRTEPIRISEAFPPQREKEDSLGFLLSDLLTHWAKITVEIIRNLSKDVLIKTGVKVILLITLGFLLNLSAEETDEFKKVRGQVQVTETFNALRYLAFTAFAILAYYDFKKQDKLLSILWTASAILINPVLKVYLSREIWDVIDYLWAVTLIGTIAFDVYSDNKKQQAQNA